MCKSNHFRANELRVNALECMTKSETCCSNRVMMYAVKSNNDEAIVICDGWIDSGADIVLCSMIGNGSVRMDEICKSWRSDDMNRLAKRVSYLVCLELFRLCKKQRWGSGGHAKHYFVLYHATFHGFTDIVDLCIKWKTHDFDGVMCSAAGAGRTEIVRMCRERGANNFHETLYWATRNGHIEIIKLCRK